MPPKIERVVKRVEPLHGWEDLKLAGESRAVLEKIKGRLGEERPGRRRGRSATSNLTVLFSGSDRSAKLIAAEILAKEAGSVLNRVSVSALVSRELAETEQAMRPALDAAEKAGGVLYLEDTDPLFRPAENDPYPERGASYLIKRMGKFAGLSILSVSDRKQVDPALLRRFRFSVSFD